MIHSFLPTASTCIAVNAARCPSHPVADYPQPVKWLSLRITLICHISSKGFHDYWCCYHGNQEKAVFSGVWHTYRGYTRIISVRNVFFYWNIYATDFLSVSTTLIYLWMCMYWRTVQFLSLWGIGYTKIRPLSFCIYILTRMWLSNAIFLQWIVQEYLTY